MHSIHYFVEYFIFQKTASSFEMLKVIKTPRTVKDIFSAEILLLRPFGFCYIKLTYNKACKLQETCFEELGLFTHDQNICLV